MFASERNREREKRERDVIAEGTASERILAVVRTRQSAENENVSDVFQWKATVGFCHSGQERRTKW